MILELYVVFGVLAFLLLCLGLWWRDQLMVLSAGFIFFVLGLLIITGGLEGTITGITTIDTYNYINSTFDNSTLLINATQVESFIFETKKDVITDFLGLLLMGLGFYLSYVAYLDIKVKRA